MTLAVMRFITTPRVGRHFRVKELEKEPEARDESQGLENKKIAVDYDLGNKEGGEGEGNERGERAEDCRKQARGGKNQ